MKYSKVIFLAIFCLITISLSSIVGVVITPTLSYADGGGTDPPIKDSIPGTDTLSQNNSFGNENIQPENTLSFWELLSFVITTTL